MTHGITAFVTSSFSPFVLTNRWRLHSPLHSVSTCQSPLAHSFSTTTPNRTSITTTAHATEQTQTKESKKTKDKAGSLKSKKGSSGGGSGKREKKSAASPGLLKALDTYEPVIGIEVHVQLSTRTKAYCNCSTKAVRTPNTNICPVCMGHPGALPVVNSKVVELAAKAGMALECTISRHSSFDRKNYYYADTAKNYQITQDKYPIALNGKLQLASSGKEIGITRLHMEEDSAKMSHEGGDASGRLTDSTHSLIDFNRSGMPLAEIVSEPDLRSGLEVAEYGQELQRILRYVGTSDCNMQDGSLRCDVNVSIRKKGNNEFGSKVELKNLNSFSSAQKSVDFEIERQASVLDKGGQVIIETRTWDEKSNETKTMRIKEGAADYRYFPEPDLPPLNLNENTLKEWKEGLPELPAQKRERYQREFGLSNYDSFSLSDNADIAKFFEDSIDAGGDAKQVANWIMGDITKVLKSEKLDIRLCKLSPEALAGMVKMIDGGIINGKVGKDLIPELVMKGGNPVEIVEERDLKLIEDVNVIKEMAQKAIDNNPKELTAFKDVSLLFNKIFTYRHHTSYAMN